MTIQPWSSSVVIAGMPKIRFGNGDGTTRRKPSASGLNVQPFSPARASASAFVYIGPIGFVGFANAGSFRSTSIIVSSVAMCLENGSAFPSSCSRM